MALFLSLVDSSSFLPKTDVGDTEDSNSVVVAKSLVGLPTPVSRLFEASASLEGGAVVKAPASCAA